VKRNRKGRGPFGQYARICSLQVHPDANQTKPTSENRKTPAHKKKRPRGEKPRGGKTKLHTHRDGYKYSHKIVPTALKKEPDLPRGANHRKDRGVEGGDRG